MNFISYASSSRGNFYELRARSGHRLLIECGLPFKGIQRHLRFDFRDIDGCIVSHEHQDHARAARTLSDRGIDIYTAPETATVLGVSSHEISEGYIGEFRVLPFPTYHDAVNPFGVLVEADGQRMVFATDTFSVPWRFSRLDFIAVECNHIGYLLNQYERIPERIIRRIANNHFELERLIRWLNVLDQSRLRTVYLLHLSDYASDEAMILARLTSEFPGVDFEICEKEREIDG